jgi:hypothetical protein
VKSKHIIKYAEQVDITDFNPAFRRMIAALQAEHPGLNDIAMVLTVGKRAEIVCLNQGPKAKARIETLQARGAKVLGGWCYNVDQRLAVPFAVDTEPSRPNFALLNAILGYMEKTDAAKHN